MAISTRATRQNSAGRDRRSHLAKECLKPEETESFSLLLYRRSSALETAPVTVVMASGGMAEAQREKEE